MYNETLRLAQGVNALIAPLAERNTADAVEYLNTLDREDAAQVLAALPQPRAVKLLEQPELHDASALVAQLPAEQAASLLGQMADDRATDIFHGLDADQRAPLLWLLSAEARLSIQALMRYPPNTAGALMTTEFVAVPADWTVGRTLQHIREVERSRETVYAIYLLDPHSRVLTQVVTMRRLITGADDAPILEVAQV
ncbi:magnesium transporter, partial [Xanthomonas hortorum pv. hederae]